MTNNIVAKIDLGVANSGIRITGDGRFSVLDVIKFCGKKNPVQVWSGDRRENGLSSRYPDVADLCDDFKFPGRGQHFTPVSNKENILCIVGLLPGSLLLHEFEMLSKALRITKNESAQFLLRFPQKIQIPLQELERKARLNLQGSIGGILGARTLAGTIDLLTASQIIEVKDVNDWKSALGQILVYGQYYPSHQKRIHLFGESQEQYLLMVRKHCSDFNVVVTHQHS